MSLNKYMHPRNKYTKKPSFLELALKYPDFRKQVTQDEKGKVFLDFKNADALRALTTCLMKEDFDLIVELPSDRLVPTLPLRLNYLLWLEDIIGSEPSLKWGIDIGTGASCVYPLLSAKTQKWNFLATEADPENLFHAEKNVKANNLQDMIHVTKVSEGDILFDVVNNFKQVDTFDFCMCNPPFFADIMEAQAVSTSRSLDRSEASTMSTASPQECITNGGEVGFIRQMIEESTLLRNKVRVYSSMVGKKTSLAHLKKELRHQKVPNFSTTEFCQGNTMRWGIAWSFDKTVQFPKSRFEGSKKEKKPLQHVIKNGCLDLNFTVHAIAAYFKDVLNSIKVHCYQGKMAKSYTSITVTATENTWCHQRRRRRHQKRIVESALPETENCLTNANIGCDNDTNNTSNSPTLVETTSANKERFDGETQKEIDQINLYDLESKDTSKVMKNNGNESCSKKRSHNERETENEEIVQTKMMKIDDKDDTGQDKVDSKLTMFVDDKPKECEDIGIASSDLNGDRKHLEIDDENSTDDRKGDLNQSTGSDTAEADTKSLCCEESESSPTNYILKCVLRLKRYGEDIVMELEWLGGNNKELLHQIKTFLINKLSEMESKSTNV